MGKITERIDNITEMKTDQYSPTPPCPQSVKIELTGRCNFNCAFCASGYKLREKGDMDWDFYCQLLRNLRTAGVEEVGMFYLGESTILPWLDKAIKEAKDVGFPYVFLTTNGSLLNEKKIEKYMEAGLDSLKFSLNYADADQFAEIAQVKPKMYHNMIEAIKLARKVKDEGGYSTGLYASYIQYDDEQADKMQAVVDDLAPYLDEVYALPLYSQADFTGEDNSDRGFEVKAGNPGRAGNMQPPMPCWSLFTEGRVSYDGHLSACCFDHDGRFRMGNLNEMAFMDAWHSESFQKLRQAHLNMDVQNTACEDCVAYA